MPKLKSLRIETTSFQSELRIDWDNDRHQAIRLDRLDPNSVKQALLDAAELICKEQRNKYL